MNRITDDMNKRMLAACSPFLTAEYPHKVYAWSHLVTERECTSLLMDATLGEWERPLCRKLGDGAYRLELRFYRVEGDE